MPITNAMPQTLPKETLAQLEALKNRPIDVSDIPEITDWQGAKRGMFRLGKSQSVAIENNSLFEQDFVGWLSSQPVQTKQKVQDLVRVALNLGHVAV